MTRVLFTTSELHPLVKTGGLADVSFSLPVALSELGMDVRLALPAYASVLKQIATDQLHLAASVSIQSEELRVWQTQLADTGIHLWLIDSPYFSGRSGNPYQTPKGFDWPDNARRFYLFSRAVASLAMNPTLTGWRPDIVHCNDWQTGLVAAFLRDEPKRPATVFTIHNMAYQGLFTAQDLQGLDIPEHFWSPDSLEFYGRLSYLKGGLVYADYLSTVSPGYTQEVKTEPFGCGLSGLLAVRSDRFRGILNGIDNREWDPARDRHLSAHYDLKRLDQKVECKTALRQELGLNAGDADRPLLGFIGRLVEQKGIDLLLENLPWLVAQGCQIAILGTGMPELENRLLQQAAQFRNDLSLTLGYDESLAHRMTAGCDIFMMPSRFEPCGLNQMYSLRYGTVPVVHHVGGLKDTVFDSSRAPERANGFSFEAPSPSAFREALERSLGLYRRPNEWREVQKRGMAADYSWQYRSTQYATLYESALVGYESTLVGYESALVGP